MRGLAVELAGKINSRRRGHSRAGQRVLSVGGPLGQGGEERIDLSSFRQAQAREVGAEWLCWQAAERLGIGVFLRGRCGWSAAQTEVLLMNLIGRLCYPSSELKTEAWLAEQSGAPGLMGTCAKLHDEALGRAARALLEVHHDLEAYLYARVEAEFGPGSKVLYDLTNTYFEGRLQGGSLAQFAKSKEMRSDCRLIFVKSEAKKDKEDAIIGKQRKRMEEALEKIRGSLGTPRSRTQPDKVQQRIGQLRERNPAVSKAFDISAEDDGARTCRLEWSYDPVRGPGFFFKISPHRS